MEILDSIFTPQQKKKLGQGCCCGAIVLFIIIMIASFKSLGQGEIGLKFDYWSQTVSGNAMTDAGLKFVGPLNGLIKYPSVVQQLYFDTYDNYQPGEHEIVRPPVVSRTVDGLVVNVRVSFHWKIDKSHAAALYEILGSAEELLDDAERPEDKPSFVEGIVRFARGSLTTVCSEFSAAEFFANQSLVQSKMLEDLRATFTQLDNKLVLTIEKVQLKSVDLPAAYEEAIQITQAEEQDYLTASAERAVRKTQMATVEMQAVQRMEELRKAANADATKVITENEAWVEQYLLYQYKQADAYGQILKELQDGADPYGMLFELMRQKAMKSHDKDKLTVSR